MREVRAVSEAKRMVGLERTRLISSFGRLSAGPGCAAGPAQGRPI